MTVPTEQPTPATGPAGQTAPAATAAQALADEACRLTTSPLPGVVAARAAVLLLDVLATAVSGAARTDVQAIRSALGDGDGPCTVIGRRAGAGAAQAALLNGIPIAAEQLQDGHRRAKGHPAAHLVPSVLAVAEPLGASWPEVRAAIVAGYQVGVRIGMAMRGTPAGVHDIATWGAIGGAAAVAHLLSGGEPSVVAAAIDLAATTPVLPDAATVFQGSAGQHLFLGIGAQLGVLHGRSAAAGIRPLPGTLERHFGRHAALDPDGILALRQPADASLLILDGYLKRHPSCGLLHGVNDAVEDLTAGGPIAAQQIRRVHVSTYRAAADFDEPAPGNDLAARFSIPWTVAAGLAFGVLDERAFGGTALADGDLRALAGRVQVRHDPQLDPGYPDGRPAVVIVELTDGRVLQARSRVPRGDGPSAVDDAGVRSKPARLLGRAVSPDGAARLLAAAERLDSDGLGPLYAALRENAAPSDGNEGQNTVLNSATQVTDAVGEPR